MRMISVVVLGGIVTLVSQVALCSNIDKANAPQAGNLEELRPWLFADLALADVAKIHAESAPWTHFRKAAEASQRGDTAVARAELLAATRSPETRIQLLAWAALRALGTQPDAESALVVRGVVVELHNEAGIGVVAAYDDGRARFFGGISGGVIWEAPDTDAEISRLIREFLQAAGHLVRTTRATPRHDDNPVAINHVRVTVLTFGGTHVMDAYGPDLDARSAVVPPLMAATELMGALTKKRSAEK